MSEKTHAEKPETAAQSRARRPFISSGAKPQRRVIKDTKERQDALQKAHADTVNAEIKTAKKVEADAAKAEKKG